MADGPGENEPRASGVACESCGDADADVMVVRRLYVTPPAWDQEGRVRMGAEERWCFVCRTHYPHQELDPDGRPTDHELSWSTEVPPPELR